jgi:hypothetical protein
MPGPDLRRRHIVARGFDGLLGPSVETDGRSSVAHPRVAQAQTADEQLSPAPDRRPSPTNRLPPQ